MFLEQSISEESLAYKIETTQSITLMEETTEDTILSEVSKRFIKKDEFGYLHEVLVKEREQNNNEGSRAIGAFLEKLNEKVLVYTNDIGQIVSIPNFGEINEVWTDIRHDFINKFRKDHRDTNQMVERMDLIMSNQKNFLALYRQTEVATLLFPPVFIKNLKNPDSRIFQHKVFPHFFGRHLLPIKVLTSIVKNHKLKNSHTAITRIGFIDDTLFNEKDVRSLFREFYSSPSLQIDIESKYSEIFFLNSLNYIDKAMQKLNISIKDVYTFNQFINVTLLD